MGNVVFTRSVSKTLRDKVFKEILKEKNINEYFDDCDVFRAPDGEICNAVFMKSFGNNEVKIYCIMFRWEIQVFGWDDPEFRFVYRVPNEVAIKLNGDGDAT